MRYQYKKFTILLLLVAVAFILVMIARNTLTKARAGSWEQEIGRSILTLGMSVIIGGLVKFFVDTYQEEGRKYEKKKEVKKDMLNRLRGTFDAVDTSRLLIEAHQSARTYGEKMRENILPSITTLYDIKRSLVDSQKITGKELQPYLRVSLHYMIAYLTALSEEYKKSYAEISNSQSYQEAVQQRRKELFIGRLEKADPALTFRDHTEIPPAPLYAWNKIEKLPYLRDFLKDERGTFYYTIFIDHYEYCKTILKNEGPANKIRLPKSFDKKYIAFLKTADQHKDMGSIAVADNLVARINEEKLKRLPPPPIEG